MSKLNGLFITLAIIGAAAYFVHHHNQEITNCKLQNMDYAMQKYPVGLKGTASGESNMIYREALENKLDAQCR